MAGTMILRFSIWPWLPGLLVAAACGFAQAGTDVVVFDEDDAAGAGYYDASVPSVSAPSALTLASTPFGGKLLILTNRAFTGHHSALLEWKSAPGGSWLCFLASPGFAIRDLTGCSNLVLFLNGPQAIPAASLPRLGWESAGGQRTATQSLSSHLAAGLDGDTNTWQRIVIPLSSFQPDGGATPAQFKSVFFAQATADNTLRTLWLDNLRFTDGRPPAAPLEVVTRAGDRSVVLHWLASSEPEVVGHHVYRGASSNGPFTLLTAAPVAQPHFVDFTAGNGQEHFYSVRTVNGARDESADAIPVRALPQSFTDDNAFLAYLQQTAFDFFWYEANPTNGLVRDRTQPWSACSIAAVGFGLTGIGVAIDHGWITRERGRQRVLAALRTFYHGPQGTNASGRIGHKGWFYHFLDMQTATRYRNSELSSVDTALLLAGVLYARDYFDADQPEEHEIRSLASALFNRVDWQWMANGGNSLAMGWQPESGFLTARWIGYNEATLLYLLGLGAATNPLPAAQWNVWTSGYQWRTNYGQAYVQFPPLFGHQFSHCWVDFRHVGDAYMRNRGLSYFENSRRATLAQRAYCIANPGGFTGYGSNTWGLTACDGPGFGPYAGYRARGAPPPENDDGTLAPTAVASSLPFAPEVCLPALRHLYDRYRTNLWCSYGFRDAFNLTAGWWDPDVLGIDQGPILLMLENHRTQAVWRRFMRIPEVQRGLRAAGFTNLTAMTPSIQRGPGAAALTVSWPSAAGRSYQVEYSPDLRAWLMSPTGFLTATGTALSWTDNGPPATEVEPVNAAGRYYRVFRFNPP
jgi:hypothetical protein